MLSPIVGEDVHADLAGDLHRDLIGAPASGLA